MSTQRTKCGLILRLPNNNLCSDELENTLSILFLSAVTHCSLAVDTDVSEKEKSPSSGSPISNYYSRTIKTPEALEKSHSL
jgi:hypothetical protein